MRLFALIFAGWMLTGAGLQATAQDESIEIDRMPVRTTADSDQAVPEWYQRFTFQNNSVDARPEWTGSDDDRDVQVTFAETRRWQLRLGLTSRDGSTGLPREEMSAGATFNITPRFSIGGAVSLGAEDLTPNGEWNEQELETGIRLQSAFKF